MDSVRSIITLQYTIKGKRNGDVMEENTFLDECSKEINNQLMQTCLPCCVQGSVYDPHLSVLGLWVIVFNVLSVARILTAST